MIEEEMDHFLIEATHAVAAEWYAATGLKLTEEELYEIKDWLSQYFSRPRGERVAGV